MSLMRTPVPPGLDVCTRTAHSTHASLDPVSVTQHVFSSASIKHCDRHSHTQLSSAETSHIPTRPDHHHHRLNTPPLDGTNELRRHWRRRWWNKMTSRQRPLVFLLLAAVAISVGSIIFSLRQPSNEETADAVLPMPDADVSTAARTAMDDTMHGNMDVNVIANAKTPSTHGSNAQRDGHAIDLTDSNTEPLAHRTKILGFADVNYKEHAVRWYHRLTKLGYDEHVIVATDDGAASHFRSQGIQRFERSPYDTCVSLEDDKRRYRRQLFGRRWKYLVDTLKNGSHVLLTDVDNVFATYVPMSEFEQSEFDVIHAYSTSYPEDVFFEMGFTVCGGMGWYRASPKVRQFAGTLLNQCNCLKQVDCKCYCDDQVILNNILWKGKHEIAWDQPVNETPKQLGDWQWHSKTGTSSKTKHRVQIWNRTFAYRGPMPDKCFADTWVAMPLYVEKADVNKAWDQLCIANPSIA